MPLTAVRSPRTTQQCDFDHALTLVSDPCRTKLRHYSRFATTICKTMPQRASTEV